MDKVAQPKWAKEAVKHVMNGRFGKANKIVKNVRKGMSEGSTLNVTNVIAAKKTAKGTNLPSKMTLGDERRRIAKKKSVKKLFISDKVR